MDRSAWRMAAFRSTGEGHVHVGDLTLEGKEARRTSRFAYAPSYLRREPRRAVDPVGLPMRTKSIPSAHGLPLSFHDAGPDGWGKAILRARYPDLRLGAAEYLALGGPDRTGDLRFGPTSDRPKRWEPDGQGRTRPDEDDLGTLLDAASRMDADEARPEDLALLATRGADVGGARPKARVRIDGRDWVAKFPTADDAFDDPAVEAACMDVAQAAGLSTPERRVVKVSGRTVLLSLRFDRDPDGASLGYLSAGTLLGAPPDEYATTRTYADLAKACERIGVPSPGGDVFRRLMVNAYLRNTDDHLRNHAVVDDGSGWRLSPVFDVVPHLGRVSHVLAPAPGVSARCDPDVAFSSHASFGLDMDEARSIRDTVVAAARRLPEFLADRLVGNRDASLLVSSLPEAQAPLGGRSFA